MARVTSARSASVVFENGEGPWAEFVNWLESYGHRVLAAEVHAVLPIFLAEPRAKKEPAAAAKRRRRRRKAKAATPVAAKRKPGRPKKTA